MDNMDKCDIIFEVLNEKDDCVVVLSFEFLFCGDMNESDFFVQIVKNGLLIVNYVLNFLCCVMCDILLVLLVDMFINECIDENIFFEFGCIVVERNWSLVSCGGVICFEFI